MNTLKENTNTSNKGTGSPTSEMSIAPSESAGGNKPKSPLKKEELEKIAKQLKNKLSKASITAKQSLSPTAVKSKTAVIKSSPLKNYMLKNLDTPNHGSHGSGLLSSSPTGLYSPQGNSPGQINPSSNMFLASSPLRGESNKNEMESPSKKRKLLGKDGKSQPQMVLQQIHPPSTPPKFGGMHGLKPSPSLKAKSAIESKATSNQTTPELQKRQLHMPNQQQLLKTPTSAHSKGNGQYNDEEGADLLMYLATSPSPAKPMFSTSSNNGTSNNQNVTASSRPTSSNLNSIISGNSSGTFIAPPPLTPKRPIINSAKTPQNRLTPSVNLFNNLNSMAGSALPSSGLALTPAGFNMNDYVNFFTPSPGGINMQNPTKNFLKTPDINGLLNNGQKQRIDGKMINFDKVLFGNNNSSIENQSKE